MSKQMGKTMKENTQAGRQAGRRTMTISAAPPWMGVLMAARSQWLRMPGDRESISGRWRVRPSSVRTRLVRCASSIRSCCHSRTSGRSAYHRSRVSMASGTVTFQSLARPWAVLP